MAKILCPHCKAVNQDVSLNDPCWQCGTILSAPPSALETGEGPPSSAASSANVTDSNRAPVQQQVERDKGDSSPSPHHPSPTLNKVAIWIIVLVIALIIAIAIFFMKQHG
jgi:hypothetical protein